MGFVVNVLVKSGRSCARPHHRLGTAARDASRNGDNDSGGCRADVELKKMMVCHLSGALHTVRSGSGFDETRLPTQPSEAQHKQIRLFHTHAGIMLVMACTVKLKMGVWSCGEEMKMVKDAGRSGEVELLMGSENVKLASPERVKITAQSSSSPLL
jgi:hypothetical protein